MTKEFAMNFTGLNSKVGMLELQVSPDVISTVTEIPRGQENWFKIFKFDMNRCKEFLKQEFIDLDQINPFLEVMSKNLMPIYSLVYRSI